jgi:hypothetical protein
MAAFRSTPETIPEVNDVKVSRPNAAHRIDPVSRHMEKTSPASINRMYIACDAKSEPS